MITLNTPLRIGTMLLNNRLYRAPVLEGAGGAENPAFKPLACESCNQCIPAQMLGMPGVCYNPGAQKRRAQLRAGLPTNE
jgi:hypothetical protein